MSRTPNQTAGRLIALVVGATRLTNRRLESTPPYASFPDVADSGGRD